MFGFGLGFFWLVGRNRQQIIGQFDLSIATVKGVGGVSRVCKGGRGGGFVYMIMCGSASQSVSDASGGA